MPNPNQLGKASTSTLKCFGCGEAGHRLSECKKVAGKKVLLLDANDLEEEEERVSLIRLLM